MEVARDPVMQVLTQTRRGYYLLVAVLVAVVALGAYAWSRQLTVGLGVTGMNTPAYWALYIVNFVFFIGISAGGIMVAAVVHALGIERFRGLARMAEVVAITALILAAVAITLDLGRPDRVFLLVRYARWGSPLIWDLFIISVYLALALALGYFSSRVDIVRCMERLPGRRGLYRFLALGYTDVSPRALARDRRVLKVLAWASIPGAVALHSVTAWILGLVKATPGWHSALLAPLFVGSALVSGLALVILAAVLSRRFFRLEAAIPAQAILDLGRLLAVLIPLLGYFLFAEFLTVVYAGIPVPRAFFAEMMLGRYAPIFWFDLVMGLVVPFLILVYFRTLAGVGVASLLVVLGVLAERTNIVLPPLLNRSLLPYEVGSYSPTWVEYSLMATLYAVGVLAFVVFAKLFPLVETRKSPGD